jgi:hypothetical protein
MTGYVSGLLVSGLLMMELFRKLLARVCDACRLGSSLWLVILPEAPDRSFNQRAPGSKPMGTRHRRAPALAC